MVPSAMYSVVLPPSLMVFFMVYTIKKCGVVVYFMPNRIWEGAVLIL